MPCNQLGVTELMRKITLSTDEESKKSMLSHLFTKLETIELVSDTKTRQTIINRSLADL
jgi:hypothetical protein